MRTPAADEWVYIVDDDEAVRSGLALLARSYGWRCRAFASAAEFLDASVDEQGACLLLDLNMPVMSGVDLLRELRGRGSSLPVIVMTGKRDSPMLAQARAAAPQAVLLKPFQSEAFEAAVTQALHA